MIRHDVLYITASNSQSINQSMVSLRVLLSIKEYALMFLLIMLEHSTIYK